MPQVKDKILVQNVETVLGERFAIYSKYIIQERALPDVRDGLKPVQRRILYSMYKDKNTFDKQYRKSVKTVGNVIGNYHPHGDSSVYEAMVRMSQDWKLRSTLIDIHGNNGSIDGDPPAAMRYTEARLSKLASQMLRNIEKETVDFVPNFDDTTKEPTVLPARYPNILVNGSTGISAGYATDIPPHNLGEVIEAIKYRLHNPSSTACDIMNYIKGPDFPTGGIIQGVDEIKRAYETGKGKIVLRGEYTILERKYRINITSIPYEVNKANLIKKFEEIKLSKKVNGISDIRDESDKNGLSIVIYYKKDADPQVIINYLLKYTNLQKNYNFNMVAINEKRPMLMGINKFLDAYIDFQKDVITKRTQYDLKQARARLHILDGLVKMVSHLDKIIKLIRKSKNKKDAKEKLMDTFDFSEKQAEAIVTLQLYRLSNTDVVALEEEARKLTQNIKDYEQILFSDDNLINLLISELDEIKTEFSSERICTIQDKIENITISKEDIIKEEHLLLTLTKDGYIKTSSKRSEDKLNAFDKKPEDYLLVEYEVSSLDHVLAFTNFGNYIILPVYDITKEKWGKMGEHISKYAHLENREEVISALYVKDFNKDYDILLGSSSGMIKRTKISDFKVSRYSKTYTCMKLKSKEDRVVDAYITDGSGEILVVTENGMINHFNISEVPISGAKSSGVKSINIKDNDKVSATVCLKKATDRILLLTNRGNMKRIRPEDIKITSRATRGIKFFKHVASNPHRIIRAYPVDTNDILFISNGKETITFNKIESIRITGAESTGTNVIKNTNELPIVSAEVLITNKNVILD